MQKGRYLEVLTRDHEVVIVN